MRRGSRVGCGWEYQARFHASASDGHCSCTGVLAGKGAFAKAIRSGLHGLWMIAISYGCAPIQRRITAGAVRHTDPAGYDLAVTQIHCGHTYEMAAAACLPKSNRVAI